MSVSITAILLFIALLLGVPWICRSIHSFDDSVPRGMEGKRPRLFLLKQMDINESLTGLRYINTSHRWNKSLRVYLPGDHAPARSRSQPIPLPKESTTIMSFNDTSTNKTLQSPIEIPPYRWPETNGTNCAPYKAVLHIASGDQGAAAGTLFFQYMVNQLIYADMHNLMPWIHLNNITQWVYDEDIHGIGSLSFPLMDGWKVPWVEGPGGSNLTGAWPGEPFLKPIKSWEASDGSIVFEGGLKPHRWHFQGQGVWNDYFEPVSNFNPNDPSCQKLGLIQLDYYHLNPGIQFYAPFAVRSWEYHFLPSYLRSNFTQGSTLHHWYGDMREKAHNIVNKYFKFKPNLVHSSYQILPNGTQCLGLHIRHSDKSGLARRKLPVQDFLPYMEEYIKRGGGKIYLATDSSKVVQDFHTLTNMRLDWFKGDDILIVQNGIVRSDIFKPVFKIGKHHQTNTEVLIDILSLSRCQFLVHGFSAVSESAIYLNLKLHNNSVDLEDSNHMTPQEFGDLVKKEMRGATIS